MIIYLDVDDTLADFKAAAKARGIEDAGNGFYTADPSTWTEEQKEVDRRVREVMDDPTFWRDMPVAPRAFEIISAASLRADVRLLTALPRDISSATREMILSQKVQYCANVLHFPRKRIVVCERHQKVLYASNHTSGFRVSNVLVDDARRNISEWEQAGGIGKLHTDADNTLSFLRSL